MSPGQRPVAYRTSPPFSRQRNDSSSSLHSERSHRFSSLDKNKHPTVVRATRIPSPDRKARPSTGYRPHVKNIFMQPGNTPPGDDNELGRAGMRSTSSPMHTRNLEPTHTPARQNIPRKPIPALPRINVDVLLDQPLPLQPRRLQPSTPHNARPTTSHSQRPMPRPPTRRPETAGYDRPPRPRPGSSGIPVAPPRLRRAETSIHTHTHAAHQNTSSAPVASALGSLANVLNLKRFSRPGVRRTDSMATVGTEGEERPSWDAFLTLPRDEGSYTKFPRFEGGRKSVMERLVGKVGGSGVRPGTSGMRPGTSGGKVRLDAVEDAGRVKEKKSWWSWGKTESQER